MTRHKRKALGSKPLQTKSLLVGLSLLVIGAGLLIVAGARLLPPTTKNAKLAVASNPCAGAADQVKCFTDYFNGVVASQGAKPALDQITALTKQDSGVEANCHPILHAIGRAAYKKYGSVTAATKYATELCWSGYYHGVMEGYMATYDDAALMAKMPSICVMDSKGYSFDYYNCLHGLGHGVTIRFNNDVFKALPYCQAVHGDWEQQSCYSGVFMQNIVVDGVNHASVNLKTDDPVYPCDAVDQQMKQSCYLMVTSYVLKVKGYDYAATFKVCDGVESSYVETCYQSLGRDISGAMLLDPAKIIPLCELGRADSQKDCYIGAVKNAVFNDRGTTRADELCRAVNVKFKGGCVAARDEAASTL